MAERSESEMARTIRDGCARTVWHASCVRGEPVPVDGDQYSPSCPRRERDCTHLPDADGAVQLFPPRDRGPEQPKPHHKAPRREPPHSDLPPSITRHSSSQSIRPRKGHDARDDKEQGGPTVDCESEQEGEGVRDREEVGERGDPCDG